LDQIRVVFLGTSAGAPTRERNVACVAVVLDGRALLFDCGEGTQQQLLRGPIRFGAIDAVFITHLHGDHLFGLPGLVATLGMYGRTAPLDVYGPSGLTAYVDAVRATSQFHPAFEVRLHDVSEGLARAADGYRVTAAPLIHSVDCLGFAVIEDDRPGVFDVERARELGIPEGPLFGQLQRGNAVTLPDGRIVPSSAVVGPTRPGRRIVYCTDTRPCDAAVALARNADVLIHESTYANDMATEAVDRFHATAREAATIAARARARQLILTHFSARYPDTSLLVEEARAVFPNTLAAHDFAEHEVLAPTPPHPYNPPSRESPPEEGS
jgi:ribonuclease Z